MKMLARKLCLREQLLSILWSENIDKLSKPLFCKNYTSVFFEKKFSLKIKRNTKTIQGSTLFGLVQIDPNLFWLSLRTKFCPQSLGHKMLVTKFQSQNVSYKSLVTYFSHNNLVRKLQSKNFSHKFTFSQILLSDRPTDQPTDNQTSRAFSQTPKAGRLTNRQTT